MIDATKFHPELKGYRFRAVKTMDIETGKVVGWQLLLKPRGKGYKWKYAGSDDDTFLFDSEGEAREAAQACNEWASA